MIAVYVHIFIGALAFATLNFIIGVLLKRNDFADIAWGIGFILVTVYMAYSFPITPIAGLIYTLVFLWGIRLSSYLLIRNTKKSEDFRYQNWRNEWGKSFYWRSFLQVYILQTFLLVIIATPIVFVGYARYEEVNVIHYVAVIFWLVGFTWQSVGDHQLMRFKKDNKGKIMTTGLWKYSRHPNYFGELLMWWAIYIMVLPINYGFFTFIGPLTIHLLIVYVSGVPMLEAKYKNDQAFDAYKEKTPAIFPNLF